MSKKIEYPKVTPVIVKWLDSVGTAGWKDTPCSNHACISVGHLVKKDKNSVILAMNNSHYGHGDFMDIPACAVKSVKRLKE